jgi:hypothetical protein
MVTIPHHHPGIHTLTYPIPVHLWGGLDLVFPSSEQNTAKVMRCCFDDCYRRLWLPSCRLWLTLLLSHFLTVLWWSSVWRGTHDKELKATSSHLPVIPKGLSLMTQEELNEACKQISPKWEDYGSRLHLFVAHEILWHKGPRYDVLASWPAQTVRLEMCVVGSP